MKKKSAILELVYGVHPIQELLKAKRRRLMTLYTTKPEPKAFTRLAKLFPKGLQLQYLDRKKLADIAGSTEHQGFVGLAQPFEVRKKFFDPANHPFIVLLDGIQDVRNLGAILRTAYCTHADGIILCTYASAPINAAALKASAGLAEHLSIFIAQSPGHALSLLEQAGYTLYVTLPEQGTDITHVPFTLPLCLAIGSEHQGVSAPIAKKGIAIRLAQRSTDISYNASVAAGISLFTIATQIKKI